MDNFNIKKFFKRQYLAEAEAIDEVNKNVEDKVAEYHTYLMKVGGKELAGTPDQHLQGIENLNGDFDKYLQNEINYWESIGREDLQDAVEKFVRGDMNENDDVQVDLNTIGADRKAKGGDEEDYFRKSHRQARGTKVKSSGEGKGPKRSFNKRNRKDAKNVLDKYKKEN